MTTKVATSVEAILALFPNQVEKIHGIPMFDTLRMLKKSLQLNAVAIPCSLGGGRHGYLGLVLNATDYATQVGVDSNNAAQPFVRPVNPGKLATIVGNTSEARATELRLFNHKTFSWQMYDNVHQALRKLVLAAVEDTYLSTLYNPVSGYRAVTINSMLAHLFITYGEITINQIYNNKQRLNEPWDGAEPFENIIKKVLNRARRLVTETGLYHDDMDKWTDGAQAKTWAEFKTHILAAQRKQRIRAQTSKQTGYGLAIQKITELADGVANAVTSGESKAEAECAIQQAKDVKTQATIAHLTSELAIMKKQHADLIARLSLPAANFTNIAPTGAPATAAVAAPAAAPKEKYKRVPKDEGSYCHTHGYWVTKSHNSTNCRFQKEGHQVTATRSNPMGGCDHGKPIV
jgi:hypothetical protein